MPGVSKTPALVGHTPGAAAAKGGCPWLPEMATSDNILANESHPRTWFWWQPHLLPKQPHYTHPANADPKEFPKSSPAPGIFGAALWTRLCFSPAGRGISLAGKWEFLPSQVLHAELSFWIPSPLVTLPNQLSPTISKGARAIFVTLLNYFALPWIHLLLDVLLKMKMDMKIYSKMYLAHKTFIKYY